MSSYFLIYLWTRLDAILIGIAAVGVTAVFTFFVILISQMDEYYWRRRDEEEIAQAEGTVKWLKNFAIVAVMSGALLVFVPSQKDTLMIYFIPKIAQSQTYEDVKASLEKLPKAMQIYINKYLDLPIEKDKK